ncbi:MAG: palindromic element RPE4 domain-containing protein [Rickettsia sp.]
MFSCFLDTVVKPRYDIKKYWIPAFAGMTSNTFLEPCRNDIKRKNIWTSILKNIPRAVRKT